MDFNKLTVKGQEAVAAAQELARRRGNPEIYPEHLLLALLDQELFADWQGLRADAEQKLAGRPSATGAENNQPRISSSLQKVLDDADRERTQARGRLRLDRAPVPRARAGAARGDPRVDQAGARRPARDLAGSRGQLPGAREVRPRPDRGGRGREARSRDRPRRGDPTRDPDPLAPHEEQSRPDRRARRRQDGDRRGPRAADRRARRPRGAEGPAGLVARHRRAARRLEVPRRVRGADEGGPDRDQGERGSRRSSSSTSCTRSSAPARPRAPSTPRTCSSRCSPAASSAASGRRRSTSTASTSRRTPRSSAASRRCSSTSRRSRTRSRSCAA